MSRTLRHLLKYLKNKWAIAGLVVLIILILYLVFHSGSKTTIQSAPVVIGNVVEKVSVTGSVSPIDKADLAFGKGGVVTVVAVKAGDLVKKGQLIASVDSSSDVAALQSAQAQLDELSRTLTPTELAVQKTTLENAQKSAINAVRDGYVKAQSSLVNYVDSFFTNPQSANPTIIFSTDSVSQKNSVSFQRLVVTGELSKWSAGMTSLNTENISDFIPEVNSHLDVIKSFIDSVSAVVNQLNSYNSGYTAAQIDSYVTISNTALATLNTAISTVTSAQTALSLAKSNYDLKLAGSSAQNIAAQTARVSQARAAVDNDRIYAPFDGIITKADPSVGEFASAGQSGFAIQSQGSYKIEAYVAEADIAKVALANSAEVTLDAYGQNVIFPATVTIINPAETVREGVPTYKVTLEFDNQDPRIRSGMTANTDILTHEVDGVRMIPTRAILNTATSTTVRLLNVDGKTFSSVPIVTGLKGSDGTTEIVSGVSVGEKVVTYTK